jgi:hypothetical protein
MYEVIEWKFAERMLPGFGRKGAPPQQNSDGFELPQIVYLLSRRLRNLLDATDFAEYRPCRCEL